MLVSWNANQMAGFYMKCNTWLKWVKALERRSKLKKIYGKPTTE